MKKIKLRKGKNTLEDFYDEIARDMTRLIKEGSKGKRGPYKTDAEKQSTKDAYSKKKSRERVMYPWKEDHQDLLSLGRGIAENDDTELEIDWFGDGDVEEELEEKKEKKKNCSQGNPYKDKKGRFTDPNKEGGSWSIANKSKRTGCKKGKARRPSGRSERITKLPCGRLKVDNPNVKAPYKCKGGVNEIAVFDGKSKMILKEVIASADDEVLASAEDVAKEKVFLPKDMYSCAKQKQELEATIKLMKRKLGKAKSSGAKECPISYNDALRILNSLDLAKKGQLFDKDKK